MKKMNACSLLLCGMVFITACAEQNVVPGEFSETENEKAAEPDLSLFYSGENTVWISAIEELCKNFAEVYPQYTIEFDYSTGDKYMEELKAKEASDEFPDVFEIEDPYMFEKAGKLGEINEELGSLVEQPVMVDDKIFALPFYGTSYGIIYNTVIFKKYDLSVPETFDEFLQLCEELENLGIIPLTIGGSEESVSQGWINYFFLTCVEETNEGWLKKRNRGEVSFQDEDVIRTLTAFQSFMTGDYIQEDSINMGDAQIISAMLDQKVAMYYGTSAMLAQIWESYPRAMESDKTPLGEELENDTVKMRPGWFYLPDADGESVIIENIGSLWAVSEECMADLTKKEVAEIFLKFCYKTENYRKVLQAIYGMPVTKSGVLYAAPAVQQGILTDYRYADRNEEFLGNMETPEAFRTEMKSIINSLAANTIEADTAARLLDESWDNATEDQEE